MAVLQENLPELTNSGVVNAANAGFTGKGITIAVLDDGGGVMPDMTDYASSPVGDCAPGQERHGSNVARTIHQVAPDAKVLLFNYFNNPQGDVDWIMSNRDKVDLINCSWHIYNPDDPIFDRLKELDIPIICASGNDANTTMDFPARLDWTISVGAWEADGDHLASYSNGGDNLDCVSYSHIQVPTTTGNQFEDGTSFSSPFVAAMLAIYNQWLHEQGRPRLTLESARELIKNNCKDELQKGDDLMSGNGLFTLPELKPVDNPAQFTDIVGRWSEEDIKLVAKYGIMEGVGDGKFNPEQPLTREQMAAVLVRLLNLK